MLMKNNLDVLVQQTHRVGHPPHPIPPLYKNRDHDDHGDAEVITIKMPKETVIFYTSNSQFRYRDQISEFFYCICKGRKSESPICKVLFLKEPFFKVPFRKVPFSKAFSQRTLKTVVFLPTEPP